MKKLLIWGAGDQGTVTLECALAMNCYYKIDFLDFKEKGHREIPGYTIYSEQEINMHELLNAYDEVIVATGDNSIREQKMLLLTSMDISIATIIHPTAVISPSAKVSKGSTVLAYAVIHTNAVIGMGCIINTAVIVEHDCIVEDFVNISPKSAVAGHTQIGKKSFLGIGSTIINEITVGKEVVIGAGAVVIRDVPDSVMAAGVPARIIKTQRSMIQIHNINEEAIPAIVELTERCKPYVQPHPAYNYWLLSHCSAPYTLYAEADGQVIGFVSSFPMNCKENELFVIQICVERNYRGQGIGGLLLNTLYERHQQDKAFIFECTISPENLASQKLFQKFAQKHNGSWSWQDAWFESSIPERTLRVTLH